MSSYCVLKILLETKRHLKQRKFHNFTSLYKCHHLNNLQDKYSLDIFNNGFSYPSLSNM